MIKVKNLRAISDLSLDYLVIKWEMDDTTTHLLDYRFDIYRGVGTDDENELELIGSVSANRFEFHDFTATQYKRNIKYYYSVVPVYIATEQAGEAVKCVALYNKKKDKYANYIRYTQKKYLSVIGNDKGYILTKRRFGQRCSVCWDDIRRQHSKPGCPNCFGTGYEGGYHIPYKIDFNYMTPSPAANESISMDGRTDNTNDVTIWTGSYPIINVGDIFVDENNSRYKITYAQQTTKNNEHILRQIINMQLLSTTDTVYGIIIDKEEVI